MKITAPVSTVFEAEVLIDLGAGELYCGLNPGAWESKHGRDVWLNRRGPGTANIEDFETLKKLCALARRQHAQVFLTLNLPFYPPEQYQEITALVEKAGEYCGVDAFIVSDPGLMVAIKEACPKAAIHVSSLAAVLNSSSVDFYRSLGAKRIIFPRYLDLAVLKEIMDKAGRDLEYEVFILNDGCVFEEGYCHVSHAFGGAFCHNPWWSYQPVQTGRRQGAPDKETFEQHLNDYQWWLWLGIKNSGGVPTPKGHPLGMCGLCALPELKALGVDSLKIVGREAVLRKKEASVMLVKTMLDYLDSGADADSARLRAKEIREIRDLCATGYMCYYR